MRKRKRCGKPKFIFVVGGNVSGIGKGAATSSIAAIIQAYGYRVTAMKMDPYINCDAGTLNPIEHGESFVTVDGMETDQDIGNYERFLGTDLTSANYATKGQIYDSVIRRERALGYEGKTVEVIPHVRDEIVSRVMACREKTGAEFIVVEIGGTLGEDQNSEFFHAIQWMQTKHRGRVAIVLVSHVPRILKGGELKTKPTQQAHAILNSKGLRADFILARADTPIDEPRRKKIMQFCYLPADRVISAPDVKSIYEIPCNFEREGFGLKLLHLFRMRNIGAPDMRRWDEIATAMGSAERAVRIAVVGKYFRTGDGVITDAYLSVIEAIKHACWVCGIRPEIEWLDAEAFGDAPDLSGYAGLIVPGGFGDRGIEGKIAAIRWAREHGLPYLGLCYGMQLAVVEFARHVAGLDGAHTTEIAKDSPHPVIDVMPDQKRNIAAEHFGASMRLGSHPCRLAEGTVAARAYGADLVKERHRHRYEVNNVYRSRLEAAGLAVSGASLDGRYVEVIEVPGHPFFVGTQFHPELQSRPFAPHPLFVAFVRAALAQEK